MTAPAAEVLWKPLPGFQTRFLANGAFECLAGGAAGPGKTDCLLMGGLGQIHLPSTRVLFLRETFPELREVMDRAQAVFKAVGGEWRASENRWKFPSGASYEFGFAKTYADLTRYQGQEFTEVRWDEIGNVPEEKWWTYLMSRVRSTDPNVRLMMRCSANPGGVGHGWLKRRFIETCGRDGGQVYTDPVTGLSRAFVPGRLSDNPFLPDSYRRQLMALPEVTRKQLLDGDWDAAGGLFFSDLREDVHLVPAMRPEDIPPYWERWSSFDWGFAHPFVAMEFAKDTDGTIFLLDSVSGRRMLPDEIAERMAASLSRDALQECYAGHDVWAVRKAFGPVAPAIAEVLEAHGIYPYRAAIDRVAGWTELRRALSHGPEKAPTLRICDTPGNRRAIDSLLSMVSDDRHPEDMLKVDADENGRGGDDYADCLRYGIATRILKPQLPIVRDSSRDLLRDRGLVEQERHALAGGIPFTVAETDDPSADDVPLPGGLPYGY